MTQEEAPDADDGKGESKAEVFVKTAIQYVWAKEEMIEMLMEDVQGKVYLRKPERGFKLIPEPWNDEPSKYE